MARRLAGKVAIVTAGAAGMGATDIAHRALIPACDESAFVAGQAFVEGGALTASHLLPAGAISPSRAASDRELGLLPR